MSNKYADRSRVVRIIFIVSFVLFVGRLAMLQLFSSEYKEKAEQQSLRNITQYPARGFIYDRHGELLVHNVYISHPQGAEDSILGGQMSGQEQTLNFDSPLSSNNNVPQNSVQNVGFQQGVKSTHPEIVREEIKIVDKQPRKVTEIRVYYDDQTYETFVPAKTK